MKSETTRPSRVRSEWVRNSRRLRSLPRGSRVDVARPLRFSSESKESRRAPKSGARDLGKWTQTRSISKKQFRKTLCERR